LFIIFLILGGTFIKIDGMPPYLRFFAEIFPLAHANPMIEGIVTKGHSAMGYHFNFLLIECAIFVALSFIFYQFKKYEV